MHVSFLSLVVLGATATDAERADRSAPKRVSISTGEDHKAHICPKLHEYETAVFDLRT
jgi:hypothetical protein